MTDSNLFATIRETLFTAVIGDVMDAAGLTRQFLPPAIAAIKPGTMVVGRAMPVQVADIGSGVENPDAPPYGLLFRALDNLKSGEIYMATGGSPTYALWGGLMSVRALHLKAVGAVLEGHHRDTPEITSLDFPVFSLGGYAQDQKDRGSIVDFRCPVTFSNGTRVEPGDLVVGDIDGVVVIPQVAEADVIRGAIAKVEGEDMVRRMIEAGEPTEDVFIKTGIM